VSGGGGGEEGTSTGAAREPWLDSRRASAWPRRETTGRVRLITVDEVKSWIIFEDEQLLVVNKPGDVVCHPSKAGPWSSLVGATREYTGLPVMHLVFRLDRETSGVVVLAKNATMASRLQTAMMERKAGKEYLAVMVGELAEPVTVNQPLGDDTASPVFYQVDGGGGGRATGGDAFHAVECCRGIYLGPRSDGDGTKASDPGARAVAWALVGRGQNLRAGCAFIFRFYLDWVDVGVGRPAPVGSAGVALRVDRSSRGRGAGDFPGGTGVRPARVLCS